MVNTPMIRAAGPDDLGAVADLLTDACGATYSNCYIAS